MSPSTLNKVPATHQLTTIFIERCYVFQYVEFGIGTSIWFYGPRMQEDAFWSTLEHFWAKIGWCKHGDMRMDEFDDSMG
ncbi:unnamed protein product [Malus baccata var. baccata]